MANSYGIIGLEHAHAVAPRGTMDLVPQFDAGTMNIVEAQTALEWRRSGRGVEIDAFTDRQNTGSIALAHRLGMKATQTFSGGAQRFRMSPS